MNRRRFLKLAGGSVAAATFGTGIYTWRWEPHWVEFVERSLPIKDLPRHWDGRLMVHLSDLHIGPQVDSAYLRSVFERVKARSPDLVVYTGDFTSYDADVLARAKAAFKDLPLGEEGTVAILGNHDYGRAWRQAEIAAGIAEAARQAGVSVVRNETAEVKGLQIVGLDDLWAKRFDLGKALAGADLGRAAIVLTHNPDTVDVPGWDSFKGWILAGHTHGGQCKPPFLPAPLLPVENRRYTSGEFALTGGRRLYINRGVGHLLQVRFNVRPEVTCFRLSRA